MKEKNRIKKIAILTHDLGGGTGNHLLSMMRHWDRNEWGPVIISSAQARDRVVPDVPVRYILPSRYFRSYPFAQIRSLLLFNDAIKKADPDIVHTFFFWSILYGRLLKRTGRINALVENREDQGFDWGLHEYAWLRKTRNLPDRVICVSEAVKRVVIEREGIEEDRVVVIHNGVDENTGIAGSPAETRRELGFRDDHLVLGMVANYNRPVKGVANFLDAVPRILSEVPSARFLFVGGGEEGQALREKARALGVEPYVRFSGYRKDIHRYYEIMDVSVLTSLSEGLSITLLESMAYGIPVVATRVGGNPELVVEGRTGYLVPVGDVPTLVERIVSLLRSPDLRRDMGTEGRRRIARDFRLRDVAERYLGIYRQLTAER